MWVQYVLTHLRPDIVFGTLNTLIQKDFQYLQMVAPLLHTTREENRENTLLSGEQVPLRPDTKITNSENRLTSPVMRAQYGTVGINRLNRVISRLQQYGWRKC